MCHSIHRLVSDSLQPLRFARSRALATEIDTKQDVEQKCPSGECLPICDQRLFQAADNTASLMCI